MRYAQRYARRAAITKARLLICARRKQSRRRIRASTTPFVAPPPLARFAARAPTPTTLNQEITPSKTATRDAGASSTTFLGVEPGADVPRREIRVSQARRRVASPTNGPAPLPRTPPRLKRRLKSVQRAYATLSDAKQRKLYDLDPARFDEREL